ncbi:MAG: PEP-CTERM sorting domain-containing protein [Planctomycetes bacterium]|nr:PEP-CTERM sorting domain-containing protein [Planctomycetota bacterium]
MKNLEDSHFLIRAANEHHRLALLVACAVLAVLPIAASAQTEMIPGVTIGMDNQFVFPHTSLPGATGIDFSFMGAFAPHYPPEESHTVVIVFEWGPTATGPWSTSPDNVNTVPGGMTDLFATGVYHGPEDAPFVAIHFYAGDFMTVSGEFTHTSVIPEPSAILLVGVGLMSLPLACRRRRAKAV